MVTMKQIQDKIKELEDEYDCEIVAVVFNDKGIIYQKFETGKQVLII